MRSYMYLFLFIAFALTYWGWWAFTLSNMQLMYTTSWGPLLAWVVALAASITAIFWLMTEAVDRWYYSRR